MGDERPRLRLRIPFVTRRKHAHRSDTPMTQVTFPNFGKDTARVAGYTDADHEVFARVFSPLSLPGGSYLKWSVAAASVGIELSATTRWYEIDAASRVLEISIGWPQQGTLDEESVDVLIRVLTDRAQHASSTHFVLWQGYGGEIDRQVYEESVLIPSSGEN